MTSDQRAMARTGEIAEAEFLLALFEAAPDDVQTTLGMSASRVAGGVVCAMEHDPTGGMWSRALGHGFGQPLDGDVLDEILETFRAGRVAVGVVQPSPLADPPDWPDLFASRGLTAGRTWVKFLRPLSDLPSSATDLEIRQVDAQSAAAFATAYVRGFGMPAEGPFHDWFAVLPNSPGWHCFGAWDGDSVVASANLFAADDVGVLAGAATVEEARGRGAQGALMSARMALSADLGMRWLSTETGSETVEGPNPSLHNMRRLGFTELSSERTGSTGPTRARCGGRRAVACSVPLYSAGVGCGTGMITAWTMN